MIASLKGRLTLRAPDQVVVEVGGIGYKVLVSLHSFARLPALGEEVFLHVHTAVREDDISLFGFVDEAEKKVFQKLIGVNGIGPKLALTILSGIGPEELVTALHTEDLARLTAIQGIGRKTAERMVLDLKDKLAELQGEGRLGSSTSGNGKRKIFDEAVSALVNLGYTRIIAERTLLKVSSWEKMPLEGIIRQALKSLSEATR